MYFPFFILHGWEKRSTVRPQTIYSEIPKIIYHKQSIRQNALDLKFYMNPVASQRVKPKTSPLVKWKTWGFP